jgi:DNA polymerase III delta prime subunit
MSDNFPHQLRPRLWTEVKYQPQAVQTISNWFKQDSIPSFIFITGATGVGKTSIAKLLIQTTHCLVRAEGEAANCGYCAICQADPQLSSGYSNVVWVAAESAKDSDGKEITYQRSIIEALHQADRGPSSTGAPHRDVLFVVFEEAQLMPKDLIQRCLARADASNPYNINVVLVFLSMSPEDMPARIRQAISQRGSILELAVPSTPQIANLLSEQFEISPEASLLIASSCAGSIRGAYSAYKDCADFMTPVSVESVRAKLGLATEGERQILWRAIINKESPAQFKQTTAKIMQGNQVALVKLLQEDLDLKYKELGENLWWTATRLLGQYLINPKEIALTYLMLNLRALNWPSSFLQLNPDRSHDNSLTVRLLTEPWSDLYHPS